MSQDAQNDVVDDYLMEPGRSPTFWDDVSQEFSRVAKTGPAIEEKLAILVNGLVGEELDDLISQIPATRKLSFVCCGSEMQ